MNFKIHFCDTFIATLKWFIPGGIYLHCLLICKISFTQDSTYYIKNITDLELESNINRIFQKAIKSNKVDFSFAEKPIDKTKFLDQVWGDIKTANGQITTSYSYGLNTIYIDSNRSVGSIFNTHGDLNSTLFKIPLNISFNYSTLKIPLGTTNYFRASYDKNKMNQIQVDNLNNILDNMEDQEQKFKTKKGELLGTMGLMEVNLDKLKNLIEKESQIYLTEYEKKCKKDLSLDLDTTNVKLDFEKINTSKLDSLNSRIIKLKNYQDSLQNMYSKIVNTKQKVDSLLTKVENAKNTYSQLLNDQVDNTNFDHSFKSKSGFLNKINSLDVGLSYPKTTGLSNQNVPIKGINIEFQFNKIYLAIASGLTLNNWMFSVNEIQNQLNFNQNVFNQFDFQRIKNNGWRTTVKSGYGSPGTTHALIGINYLTPLDFLSSNHSGFNTQKQSAAIELDLAYLPTFYKGGKLEVVYGKTSANQSNDSTASLNITKAIFSNYASNLLNTKYTQNITIIKSELSINYRRIDPFANTASLGVTQPNHQRLEFKSTHRIHSLIRMNVLYKREETLKKINQLNEVKLDVFGLELSGYKSKIFNYSVHLNQVYHTMKIADTIKKGSNYIFGASISSNYETDEFKFNSNVNYNDFLISDSINLNKFTQFSLNQSMSGINWSAGVFYELFIKKSELNNSKTNVFGINAKYTTKKISWHASIKYAYSENTSSVGGHLEVIGRINKWLEISLKGERFVMGDFYRNFYRTQYEQFPYLITIQSKLKF